MKAVKTILTVLYLCISAVAIAESACTVNIEPYTVRIARKPVGVASVLVYTSWISEGVVGYFWQTNDSIGKTLESGNVYSPITWSQQGDSIWIQNNLIDSLGVTLKP